jgi:hypothetical protein
MNALEIIAVNNYFSVNNTATDVIKIETALKKT